MAAEDDVEFVKQRVWFILDASGSMLPNSDPVFTSIISANSKLGEINSSSIDIKVYSKIVTYNDEVHEFNEIHLEPSQLCDTFKRENYKCEGCTNEGAVLKYIDSELSRSKPAIRDLKKNSPGNVFIIYTDGKSNEPATLREEARRLLSSNFFYKHYTRILVVYIGDDEKHKNTAVALANGVESNVFQLTDNLLPHLSDFIIQNTVIMPNGTHINDENGTNSMEDVANNILDRNAEGEQSADLLTDDAAIGEMLLQLMGKS